MSIEINNESTESVDEVRVLALATFALDYMHLHPDTDLAIVFAVLVFVFPLRLLIETAAHFLSGGRLPGAGLIASFDQLGILDALFF